MPTFRSDTDCLRERCGGRRRPRLCSWPCPRHRWAPCEPVIAQITAFTDVLNNMREQLDDMPDEERTRVEEASSILRKVRATQDHKLLPLTVIRPKDDREHDLPARRQGTC